MMINEEGWLKKGIKSDLKVIPLKNYDRKIIYDLPIKPHQIYLINNLLIFIQVYVSLNKLI